MKQTAYVALGTNLGDRQAHLALAIGALSSLPTTRVLRVADAIETAPVDAPPDSPAFLNSAAALETDLEPLELLRGLLRLERSLGRERPAGGPRHAPRPIDLDLLLVGDRVIDGPDLTLPHPRMHERRFVLAPLAQIAADVVHPTSGRTVRELLAKLTNRSSRGA